MRHCGPPGVGPPGGAKIDVSAVRKIYAKGRTEVEAVSDVSFSVAEGEFVAILGPSGCGKSTLLMMCAGLEAVTSGSIRIDAMPVAGPRQSVGIMFQDSTLLPWKSVMENILFPLQIMRRPVHGHMPWANELLALTGLSGFEDRKPHELSGGMRQRVAICRALVHEPGILLMDEPFSALDAMTRDEMNAALLDLWERYTKTALFVTHSIREAIMLADRVLVMTRRPATIVEDVRVPFSRPRNPAIGETAEFNRLVRYLRGLIQTGTVQAVAPQTMTALP